MIHDMLAADMIFTLLKWLILIGIWLFLAYGLHRDNKKIRKFHDSSITSAMLQIMHRRNLQIYGLVSMILIIIIAGDISRAIQAVQTANATAAPAIVQAPPVTPPVTQEAAKPAEDTTQFVIPQNTKVPFSNITEFNEVNSKQQAYIDFLKERYETWLITYYYLQKCGKVQPSDLDLIMTSLRKALEVSHADNTVEGNIIMAANGSYKEMYSEIPCDAARIASTKSGYDTSMQQIRSATQPAQTTPQSTKERPQLKQ